MLATFCLRLALGLAGCLLLLNSAQVAPRFYRVQFLTVLGLVAVAGVFAYMAGSVAQLAVLGVALVLAFVGSFVWSLEGAPLGRTVIVCTVLSLAGALALKDWTPAEATSHAATQPLWLFLDDLASAALLGSATSAMLMGHSYLVAPAMSITPLLRLLTALFAATALRMALAGADILGWTGAPGTLALGGDALLWLPVRWGIGFLAPLVFGWMAWQSAKIRSTQSATGILYVVVIFCFLGELTGQLLQA